MAFRFRTVVVQQPVHAVDQLDDAFKAALEQPQGVGAGHHQARHLVVQHLFQFVGVDHPVFGFNGDDIVAGDGRRSWVGAVGGVGHDDLGLFVALVVVVGGHEHDARQFAVGAGHGLQGEGVHAGDLGQQLLSFVQHLQRALGHVSCSL